MIISKPNKEYKRTCNTVFSCQYHVIFSPKFRRKILQNGVEMKLKEYFSEVANKHGFEIIEQEIMPDHVHLLLSVNPDFGIKQAVSRLKGYSAKKLKEDFPFLKSRLPCIWTNSKFVSTVGEVSLEVVKQYIESQKNV